MHGSIVTGSPPRVTPRCLASAEMSEDRRRSLGKLGESLAARHLEAHGYEVLERNFRTREGELDLVLSGAGCLVFCEVKTRLAGRAERATGGPAGPLDAIGSRKRKRLRMLAARWLTTRAAGAERPSEPDLRFDAIGITLDGQGRVLALEHVEDAF